MLLKTCKETSLEITLQWVINAHGFSPYQLVFGMNTRPPNVLSNGPPALEGLSESKIIASILRSMHEARKTFIKSESSEKILCALRHNLRSYKDAIFTTGVDIYYMRNNSKRWKGPGKVIGVDGQQILVKHGSFYITCHWSHVILKDEDVRKRTLQSSHITANWCSRSKHEWQFNSCSDAQDRNASNDNHTDSLQWSDSDDDSQECHDSEWQETMCCVMPSGQSCTALTDNVKEKEDLIVTDGKVLQKGARVAYKLFDDHQQQESTIIGHAGHATGQNKFWFNIQKEYKSLESLNFEALEHWKELSTEELLLYSVSDQVDVKEAKLQELQSWFDHNLYVKVPNDGQKYISTRCVLTEKICQLK